MPGELVGDPLPLEVSADATAAEVLRDACALFGRAEEDTALEVGGVVWEAGSGDVSPPVWAAGGQHRRAAA